ncbi:DUF6301 family protein [Nocardia sp. NPDC060256]|uniref:DUF6301 family protein n=1 Tax=unclassified Nocardia TaxID=2637762 RepID=UPI003652AAC5
MAEWQALGDAEVSALAVQLLSLNWSWQISDFPKLAAEFGWQVQSVEPRSIILDVGFGMPPGEFPEFRRCGCSW